MTSAEWSGPSTAKTNEAAPPDLKFYWLYAGKGLHFPTDALLYDVWQTI